MRIHFKAKIILFLFLSGLLVLVGTIAFSLIEQWSVLDALYFTVSTVTTVGYGDLVPTHEVSKIIAILYMMSAVPLTLIFVSISAELFHDKMMIAKR